MITNRTKHYSLSRTELEELSIHGKPYPLFPSVRLLAISMVFLGQIFGNVAFSVLNFTIVCMVNSTALESSDNNNSANQTTKPQGKCGSGGNSSEDSESAYFGDIEWNREQQGNVLAGYSWGILFLTIPAGILMDKIGVKFIFALGQVISVATLLLTPAAAYAGEWWIFWLRFVAGISGGFCWPVIMASCTRWAPKAETGLLIGLCACGFPVGLLIGNVTSSLFCSIGTTGWQYAYYFWGGLNAVFLLTFWIFYTDDPRKSRFISEHELSFVLVNRRTPASADKSHSCSATPWRHLLTSMPVIATVVANFTAGWVYYFIAIFQPTYIKEVLHYAPTSNGLFSAMPPFFIFFGRLGFGHLSDRWDINKTISVKLFECCSLAFLSTAFVVLTFLGCETAPAAVASFALGACLFSLNSGGYIKSTALIAPAYIGALSGIGETFAGLSSLLVPYVVEYVIADGSPEQWSTVFYISATVGYSGAVFFLLFASGQEQPWARQAPAILDDKGVVVVNGGSDEKGKKEGQGESVTVAWAKTEGFAGEAMDEDRVNVNVPKGKFRPYEKVL